MSINNNLDQDSTFVFEQFDRGQTPEALPVTLPSGTTFVSTINGVSGSITFSGGTTGLTFTPAGATVTVGGTLAIANGGTGATSAAAARTALGAAQSGANNDINTFAALTGNTGWAAWTGTGSKASRDTTSATLTNVAEALKALIDTLLTSGVIET